MRALLFILVLMVSGFNALPQTYHPFIKPNKTWTVMYTDPMQICNVSSGMQEYFTRDTIIQGFTYTGVRSCNVISQCSCPWYCDPFFVDTSNACNLVTATTPIGSLMREDTIAKKVFIWDGTADVLLYDFSLNVGDTLYSPYAAGGGLLSVISIGYITLSNGEQVKIFNLDAFGTFIESIGSPYGMHSGVISTGGVGTLLWCVKENGVELWGSGSQCFGSVGVEEVHKDLPLLINAYFDQTGNTLHLEMNKTVREFNLSISDLTGRLVYVNSFMDNQELIDLSFLPTGVYSLDFMIDGKRSVKKILK